ncbi:PAC2 family protein [Haloarculaceae archaeon H-GB2-1]|nr:PAC2 family protein [Haloarculaceae archaeon H-GB1-1]MEA5387023.1 PAC2 family protein [Haloarculaceae archaeon H-GB11]MEA5408525.1 PAC2 family protein [Haloarculaceae archaeon H-GB2-1]
MDTFPRPEPTFHVQQDAAEATTETLIAGFSEFGLVGLTAADYLVDHLEMEQTGHVSTAELPTITPFENGTPRHPIRLFTHQDRPLSVLVSELFVPPAVAEPFSRALFEEFAQTELSDVAVMSGVPIPHGPEDHRTFYVATEDYQRKRLAEVDVPPMGSGFVDGVNANLLSRAIDSSLAVGLFTTPAHAQAPDVDAALRLVETITEVYDLDVDTEPLRSFAEEVQQYYADLAERMERVQEPERAEDRMYM